MPFPRPIRDLLITVAIFDPIMGLTWSGGLARWRASGDSGAVYKLRVKAIGGAVLECASLLLRHISACGRHIFDDVLSQLPIFSISPTPTTETHKKKQPFNHHHNRETTHHVGTRLLQLGAIRCSLRPPAAPAAPTTPAAPLLPPCATPQPLPPTASIRRPEPPTTPVPPTRQPIPTTHLPLPLSRSPPTTILPHPAARPAGPPPALRRPLAG